MIKRNKKSAEKKKIPSPKNQYSLLAELRLISYYDENNKVKTIKFKKNQWSLLWNPSTKELKGVPNDSLVKLKFLPNSMFSSKAMKDHIAFQDYKSLDNYDFTCNFTGGEIKPAKWVKLGKGKQIDYFSDKFNDGWCYYYHPFGDFGSEFIIKDHKVNIYYSEVNNFYKAKGGQLTVTRRGIIY
jgi:hypothetical protein